MITGTGLLNVLIYLVVIGLVFYVLFWGVGAIGFPEPVNKILVAVVVVALCVVLLNLLMGFIGSPLFGRPVHSWRW